MSLRKASGIDRSFSTRLLQTTGLALVLITASAAGVHAEIVIVQGDDGAAGDAAWVHLTAAPCGGRSMSGA
jgi:hypothetical protein